MMRSLDRKPELLESNASHQLRTAFETALAGRSASTGSGQFAGVPALARLVTDLRISDIG